MLLPGEFSIKRAEMAIGIHIHSLNKNTQIFTLLISFAGGAFATQGLAFSTVIISFTLMASGTKFALNKLYRECSPACLEKTYSLRVNFSSSKMSFYHCDLCIHNLSGKTTYLERTCLLDIGVGLSRQVSLYSNFECFSLLNHVQSVHDFL